MMWDMHSLTTEQLHSILFSIEAHKFYVTTSAYQEIMYIQTLVVVGLCIVNLHLCAKVMSLLVNG